MVKYSKYLLLIWVSIISIELKAQFAQESFNVIERDSEITRVTLKNHLKNWSESPLLNSVEETVIEYTAGKGLYINIDAPNSQVFLENGVQWSFEKDLDLLDTFYDAEIVKLQQERMAKCLRNFIVDFHSYFPTIAAHESYRIEVKVDDRPNKTGEQTFSEKLHLRQYKMTLSISAMDLKKLKTDKEEIEELTTVVIEQL